MIRFAPAAFMMILAGCSSVAGPLLETPADGPRWPPPPEQARIVWVGEIATSEDLKPARGALESLGDFLFGGDDPESMSGPRTVVRSRDGNRLWVTDPGARSLHRIDLAARSHEEFRALGESPLMSPVGLALGPENTIHVCDSGTGRIWRIDDSSGEVLLLVESPTDIARPVALAWKEATHELWVLDGGAHDIKVLAPDGGLARRLCRRGTGRGELNFPCAIWAGPDLVWVADAGNQRVQGLDAQGAAEVIIGRAGDAPGDLALPKGVAVDSDGHIYIVDARFENVQVFDRQGRLLIVFGREGQGPAEFWLPGGIHIDAHDRIWICDSFNRRIQVFEYQPLVESGSITGDMLEASP